MVVVGEIPRVTESLIASLVSEGYRVRVVAPGKAGARAAGSDRFEVDLADPNALRSLHGLLAGSDHRLVGAVINFLGLMEPFLNAEIHNPEAPLTICHYTFNLLKELQEDLDSSADSGGGWVVNVTGLGGRFGIDSFSGGLCAAGTLGIAKTFMRESPKSHVKNIDIDPTMDPHVLATKILHELSTDDETVEVGITERARYRLKLVTDDAPAEGKLDLNQDSVILATGGAYGVTADVTRGLLAKYNCRLVVVGRSPLPDPEPDDVANLDVSGLRQHLIQESKATGAKILPAQIERNVQRRLRDRQILANINEFRSMSKHVEYHPLDVRDRAAFSRLIDDVYTRLGNIDGVIHGAGVIDDKKIKDKSTESFTNVFRTKVDSALVLAEKLRSESLAFMVFFSSVSGRFGNAGQADYSAANEFLNKLANWLDQRWPGRVAAINWGPWDGGMVSDELRRMYATVGFDLIPIEKGVEYFLAEIRRDKRRSAEVVVSGSVAQMAGTRMS